jgi:hypothetical protein
LGVISARNTAGGGGNRREREREEEEAHAHYVCPLVVPMALVGLSRTALVQLVERLVDTCNKVAGPPVTPVDGVTKKG